MMSDVLHPFGRDSATVQHTLEERADVGETIGPAE